VWTVVVRLDDQHTFGLFVVVCVVVFINSLRLSSSKGALLRRWAIISLTHYTSTLPSRSGFLRRGGGCGGDTGLGELLSLPPYLLLGAIGQRLQAARRRVISRAPSRHDS
jgi:hypothetical protein